ncbi:MAG: STAS domain-containing protein [Cyanobacteriota bacterium]|jgi:anti-anti-sigma factor|nr:STAS domain-containing protein [Cyanobacteriota bacterium]
MKDLDWVNPMADPLVSGNGVSLEHEDLSDDLRVIRLGGRLDMVGVGGIELRLTSLAAIKPGAVLIDLTGVTFLASVGLRCIIHSAKALALKGGRMALLLGDNELVRSTLDTVNIEDIIPLFIDKDAALEFLGTP